MINCVIIMHNYKSPKLFYTTNSKEKKEIDFNLQRDCIEWEWAVLSVSSESDWLVPCFLFFFNK